MATTQPAWNGRRATNALNHVRTLGALNNTPCWICHGTIDYTLHHPHRQSCTVQHIQPRSTRPDLTWNPANWAPAHLQCNQDYGNGTATNPYNLGTTS